MTSKFRIPIGMQFEVLRCKQTTSRIFVQAGYWLIKRQNCLRFQHEPTEVGIETDPKNGENIE